ALEAFEDWTAAYTWVFLLAFPTPAQLQAAGKRKWEKFLHTHKLWRPQTVDQRLAIFAAATALPASAPVTAAKSLLAFSLAKVLRFTVHLWVNASRKKCAWAQAYYQRKREEGHSHASALRCLGKRWLKILWRLWVDRKPYDEKVYLTSLQRRGSQLWGQLNGA